MSTASLEHLRKARDADEKGDLELAVLEYRKVYEYDPSNRNDNLGFHVARSSAQAVDSAPD